MRLKALLAAAAVTAFAGSAIAQDNDVDVDVETGAVANGEPAHVEWGSEQEQLMFEDHGDRMGGFFLDETFADLRTEAEIETAWAGMTPQDQERMRYDCQAVIQSPEEYREVTVQLCQQLGEF